MEKIRPKKLGHIVLMVKDIHKSVEFYTEVVGLEVSDWIEEAMVFLRCGEDHHDLGLFQIPDGEQVATDPPNASAPGLEHFSYEIENYAEMERAVEILKAKGVEIVRGPGKHGPGENCFLVFKDPDGNFVEFYCEMVQITEDKPYKASVWPDDLDAFDQWHFKKFAVDPPELYLQRANAEKKD